MSKSYCIKEKKACVDWVDKYLKDCLCNSNDYLSFGLGFFSLMCWGVAEIPQIVTNFRTKSSHGVSLLFLLTWVAGDVFNLVGCIFEPATLPTQFYTAVLYTISTMILLYQSLYYDHFFAWWKSPQFQLHHQEKKHLLANSENVSSTTPVPTIPLNVTPRPDFYFTSARSMAGSCTPPVRSYMRTIRGGPPAIVVDTDFSSEDESSSTVLNKSVTQPKPIPRSVGYGLFLATAANLPRQTKALMQAYVGFTGRKLLHDGGGSGGSAYGQWMGWMMAGIYIGSRIPQISLNIRRGSVEGLNPLMFVFALIANLAYVASILIRTPEWEKVKPNMPWLLDAAVCVVLDLFIIMQYIYYKYLREGIQNGVEEDGYMEYTEIK